VLEDGNVTLVGIKMQVSVGAEIVAARVTVPANPFKAPMVSAETPCDPALTATEPGLAMMEKSWTVTVTMTERDNEVLVPVNAPVTAIV
jgi:hypothetical protein